ncbi:MAG: BCCT family transporter [Nitriliruptoraceae bacterium]
MSTIERAKAHIHPVVFPVSAGVILIFLLYGSLWTENAQSVLGNLRVNIVDTFGWFFVASVVFFLIFTLWLALSRHAHTKLGPDDSEPDFSTLTWFSMLFAAGMGIGLVNYGVEEPMIYFAGVDGYLPPRVEGLVAGTGEAAGEAMLLTFHHWGLAPWAIYAVLGLSLAYFGYRHGLPMTVRSALYPLIGERYKGWLGNLVDILAIFGTMFGVATSLGIGVTQINNGLNTVFDVPIGVGTQLVLIAVITIAATISVVSGLEKGIKRLSQINMTLAGLLLVFVAILGPTLLLLTAYVENIGNYIFNAIPMLAWSGAYGGVDFLNDWTIFYWAWWISWAPFVGMFIARISRGRTVREFVLGVLIVPTLVSFLWFTVMGNTAIHFELSGAANISDSVDYGGAAMFTMLAQLPGATLASIVTIFVIAIFFITSSDSASFVIDMIASGGQLDPPKGLRVFWALSEGAVAAVLLAAGGLGALQAGAIATGLPFAVVLCFVAWGLARGLAKDHAGQVVVRPEDRESSPTIESTEQLDPH